MINVTKTYLPDFNEYNKLLKEVWERGWVTNNGPLVKELETKLRDYLGVKYLLFVSNGTIALQLAIKALDLRKEIITTPFSYVATLNSILWENCKPVFVDIDPVTLNINPENIEKLITGNTEAILATHVFGIPCAISDIEIIAKKNNLKVIYDAAHTFGSKFESKHLTFYGDISTLSFHATKLFHTVEGGAVITNNEETYKKLKLLRSFGHVNDEYFGLGINGKNSEFHAAMGLVMLPKIEGLVAERKVIYHWYLQYLDLTKVQVPFQRLDLTVWNYAYFPVVFKSNEELLIVKKELEENDIFPRRYFYPSLNNLPHFVGEKCPISENITETILALPFYNGLNENQVRIISNIINKAI